MTSEQYVNVTHESNLETDWFKDKVGQNYKLIKTYNNLTPRVYEVEYLHSRGRTISAFIPTPYGKIISFEDVVKGLCEPFDVLALECDGLTRVLNNVLYDNDIEHDCYAGSVEYDFDKGIPFHFWIVLETGHIVDYRLETWLLTPDLPKGVFDPEVYTSLTYNGDPVNLGYLNKSLFDFMTANLDIWADLL